MVKAIIFDWGGVLAPADTEPAARKLSQIFGSNYQKLKNKIGKYEKENSESKDYTRFITMMEADFHIPGDEIKRALTEIPAWKGFDLAKELSKNYKTAILSDQMHFKTEYIKQNNNLSFFDHVMFSSEIGTMKPYKKTFELALKTIGEKPEDCLFIDDREINIQAAKDLGIHTIHCTDINDLEPQLKAILWALK